ncbi:MAG: 5-oxoprolinase subunit PxpA [Acidimicrobiales bacterium]
MAWIDLNADLGEADDLIPSDVAVLDSVTSASIACGFHAGSLEVMHATSVAARARGVVIGAHVSYRDREGFGRRDMDVPAEQLVADIDEQIAILRQAVGGTEGAVAYVKPHGALYDRMGRDPETASAVIEAVRRSDPPLRLLAQAGTAVIERGREAGLVVVGEAFCDRAYHVDGSLVARSEPGAVIADPAEVARRAVSLVLDGGIETIDGYWLAVMADSVCVHGDSPGAAESARAVRAALEAAGITIRSFATQ